MNKVDWWKSWLTRKLIDVKVDWWESQLMVDESFDDVHTHRWTTLVFKLLSQLKM